jgi:UDP-N-acetylmuramate--alanine ligase
MAEDEHMLREHFPAGLRGIRIHAVGAGGSGISAALWLAREHGAIVSGCDAASTSMSRLLASRGIVITEGHQPSHVDDVDLVVVSPAVLYRQPDLAELTLPHGRGIPVIKWQALLGFLMQGYTGVSVAGVHGKGSTASLLGSLAVTGGLDPTVEVGATVIEWGSNIRLGHGPIFINEADEFDYNFLYYHPRVVVLTAVEYDHPEFFASYEAIRDAFVTFVSGMDMSDGGLHAPAPTLVLNMDSPGCLDVQAQLGRWAGRARTFGIENLSADVRAEPSVKENGQFTLIIDNHALGDVHLTTPGAHNVYNALAAAAAADVLGVAHEVLAPALSAWRGLRRRFEIISDGQVTYVDDYAHHPHAITLTIETARRRFPDRRLIAVFQPTLYTRLLRFLKPFSESFDLADEIAIVEIQPSREVDTGLIHGTDLVREIAKRPTFAGRETVVHYTGTYDETAEWLRERRQEGDVIVVMGSGPVNQVIAASRITDDKQRA